MKSFPSLLISSLIISFCGITCGDVVIDEFDFGNSGGVPQTFTTVQTYSVFTSTDTSILAGVRKWQVDVTSHSIAETEIFDVASGMYGIANGFGQNATVSIRWDGQNNSLLSGGFANLDLTEGGVNALFSLHVASADVATQFEIVATDSNGTRSVTKTGSAPGYHKFFFDDFSGLDFTDIQALQLNISGDSAYDVGINRLAAIAVPEPVTSTLLAAVLTSMLATRRRRRL